MTNHFNDQPFPAGKAEPLLDPATLTDGQKRQLWEGLKQLDSALAALLTNDDGLQQLKNRFSGTVRFPLADAKRYLEAGLKKMEEKK